MLFGKGHTNSGFWSCAAASGRFDCGRYSTSSPTSLTKPSASCTRNAGGYREPHGGGGHWSPPLRCPRHHLSNLDRLSSAIPAQIRRFHEREYLDRLFWINRRDAGLKELHDLLQQRRITIK